MNRKRELVTLNAQVWERIHNCISFAKGSWRSDEQNSLHDRVIGRTI